MKKVFSEEAVLFIAVAKWVILATIIGIIAGVSTGVFLKTLNLCISYGSKYPYSFLLLPFALFISASLTKYLAPEAEGHGTEKVIEAVHKNSGKISPLAVPVKLVSTVITIALGGSAGKEGPCAQIGGGLSSLFADIFRFSDTDRKKLVICGISAGFAAVFGTPIAGAIFGVEVLFVGSILYEVLLPSIVAGIVSFYVASSMGISYVLFPLNNVPIFSKIFFSETLLAGVFFGLCSVFLILVLKKGATLVKGINASKPIQGLIGGFILILLTFIFSTKYLGLGMETIQSSLTGGKTVWYDFILKSVFTSITLNFGGSGGIITPIFFIGATSGALFATVLGLDIITFSAIGMVSVLGGAANTPIAASIMAIELFGPQIAPYAATACIISFLITGHRSVYPSQVLSIKKSSFIDVETGKRMDNLNLHTELCKQSPIRQLMNMADVVRNHFKKPGSK